MAFLFSNKYNFVIANKENGTVNTIPIEIIASPSRDVGSTPFDGSATTKELKSMIIY